MPNALPAITFRTPMKGAAAPILAVTLALLLAGCGSDKVEEELLKRVEVAEAAAARADAARIQAEKTVEEIRSSEFAEDGELVDEMEDPQEEENPDLAPENQDIDNEIVAPPPVDPAPTGKLPA